MEDKSDTPLPPSYFICTELMEMKRKQREQRKRYREKHPEIFQEQKIIF